MVGDRHPAMSLALLLCTSNPPPVFLRWTLVFRTVYLRYIWRFKGNLSSYQLGIVVLGNLLSIARYHTKLPIVYGHRTVRPSARKTTIEANIDEYCTYSIAPRHPDGPDACDSREAKQLIG